MESHSYIIAVSHPVATDDSVLHSRMRLGVDESLIRPCRRVLVQEHRCEHTPACKIVDIKRTHLHKLYFCARPVKRHLKILVHNKLEADYQRILRLDAVIYTLKAYIRTVFTGFDCDGVGLKSVVEGFNGIALFVDDLDSECPVIILYHCRHDRNADEIHVLLYRIGSKRIGKHNVFRIGISHILLLTRA